MCIFVYPCANNILSSLLKFHNKYPHQDDNIGCFWLCFCSQEEQLTAIQEQDTTENILEHGGEAKALPIPHRLRQTSLEGKRRSYTLTHCLSPRPVQPLIKRFPPNLWFLHWEKRTKVGLLDHPNIVSCFARAPTLILYHRDLGGICRTQTLGIWLWWRKGTSLQ